MIPARVKGRTHTEKLVTWIPWLHLVHLLKTSNMLSYSSTTWQYRKYMKIHERTVTTPLAHRLRDFPVPGWLPGVALCFHGLDLGFEKKKKTRWLIESDHDDAAEQDTMFIPLKNVDRIYQWLRVENRFWAVQKTFNISCCWCSHLLILCLKKLKHPIWWLKLSQTSRIWWWSPRG